MLLLAGATSAANADSQLRAQVRAAVVAALGGAVKPEDVALAPDLRIQACPRPLGAFATGPRNVAVECPGPGGWRVYVPVRVEQVAEVVVLARGARAGEPLVLEQLTVHRRDVSSLRGTGFTDPVQLVGKVPLRGLPPGAIIRSGDIGEQALLKRGDPVAIRVKRGAVSVTMEGRALGPATFGGRVTVENVSSRRVIRGRLVEPGIVQVGP